MYRVVGYTSLFITLADFYIIVYLESMFCLSIKLVLTFFFFFSLFSCLV